MIPLSDDNPTRSTPVITILLIVACTVIYVFVQPRDRGVAETKFSFRAAAIPCELTKGRPLSEEEVQLTLVEHDDAACESAPATPPVFPGKSVYLAVLYSMFLHGSWLHLGSNMLYLWIFGNNIEDKRGKVTYTVFYLLSGVAATIAHWMAQPASTVPMVGASGAIAGVMGAYLVLYPSVRIRSLILLGFILLFRDVEAKWLLAIWFVGQFFTNPEAGVAWMAHVGGFLFGIVAGLVWRATSRPEPPPVWRPVY